MSLIAELRSIPVDPREDVRVLINPNEIRRLMMWAMDHANAIAKEAPEAPKIIKAICNDLRKKIPDCPALTSAEEVEGLREKYGEVEPNIKKDPT